MAWAALGVAAVGAMGNYMANTSANDRAQALQNQALMAWMKINIPDPAQYRLALQKFVQEGQLTPQLEAAIKADPSEFTKITTDQSHKSAQMRALSELEQIGNNGGMRLQDKAALQNAQQSSIDKERGSRMAIQSDMARRGLGGSGFDVAAQLQAQQSGADRNAKSSLDAAAQAQDRALQAIMGAGDMATKYRNQDFNEQSQRAAAADRINLFNTNNMQDVQSRNISNQNRAAEMNLAMRQKIADMNTQQNNYQQEKNLALVQQEFDNKVKIAGGATGQLSGLANTAIQQGQNLGNLYTNAATGASSAITSKAQADRRNKRDEEEEEEEY